jgi:hypothetical protein
MPLVFVHGVSNRMSAEYRTGVANRDALFRAFLLAPYAQAARSRVDVHNPYWGDLGGALAWKGASIPLGEFEALGAEDTEYVALHASAAGAAPVTDADRTVLTLAREQTLVEAVDLLWAAAAMLPEDNAAVLASPAPRAIGYATANPSPGWLDEVNDDDALLSRLEREITAYTGVEVPTTGGGEWESLGIANLWNELRKGAGRLRAAISNTIGRSASDRIRPAVLPGLAMFLGDVLQYLHEHQSDEPAIAELVAETIRIASASRSDDDPLVLVAHSMGGNITYDLLTSTLADIHVDLYVTVGTQVGLFEELKLFRSSDRSIPGSDLSRRVPRPTNVDRWINVFDYSDFLGYRVGSVIDGAEDLAYRTGSLLHAHSLYFVQPSFHERLARRVHKDRA